MSDNNLNSNEAINKLGEFVSKQAGRYDQAGAGYADKIIGGGMSGFEFMRQVAENGEMTKTFNTMFREAPTEAGKLGKLRHGKLALAAAGTMGIMRGAIGAVRGAFTDGQGNIDLPGIPFF